MKKRLSTGILALALFGCVYDVATGPVTVALGVQIRNDAQRTDTPEVRPPEKASKKKDKLGPMAVFADIEAGWRQEKIGRILRHFGRGKVTISIEGIGPVGGAFSKNQSHYLLKDLFAYTITKKFEFVQFRNVTYGRTRAYAVAERAYKRNDDGRLFRDRIYVSLRLEDGRWVIGEIKSVR